MSDMLGLMVARQMAGSPSEVAAAVSGMRQMREAYCASALPKRRAVGLETTAPTRQDYI